MDPMQALDLLDRIVAQVPMNRPQHAEAIKAVMAVRRTLVLVTDQTTTPAE